MIDRTKSAMEQLKEYALPYVKPDGNIVALLDRTIDAPTDAEGEVLHVGDEVRCDHLKGRKTITYFLLKESAWSAHIADIGHTPCSELHKFVPDSRERIEADAKMQSSECADLVRRCFALMDVGAE